MTYNLMWKLAGLRDWFWDAADHNDSPAWCRAQSDVCDEALEELKRLRGLLRDTGMGLRMTNASKEQIAGAIDRALDPPQEKAAPEGTAS